MNKKTLQFICEKCKKEVFRLSRYTDRELKLCGKCGSKNKILDIKPHLNLTSSAQHEECNNEEFSKMGVLDKVSVYRRRLDKVVELNKSTEHQNKSFYELWRMTE